MALSRSRVAVATRAEEVLEISTVYVFIVRPAVAATAGATAGLSRSNLRRPDTRRRRRIETSETMAQRLPIAEDGSVPKKVVEPFERIEISARTASFSMRRHQNSYPLDR